MKMNDLISTAKEFILEPKLAWDKHKFDTTSAKDHLTKYVFPLALIPAIASFIGIALIGTVSYGYRTHSFELGITQAVISLISTLFGVWLSGFIVHKLAPTFKTFVGLDSAVRLVGFAYTPVWVAGVLNIIPMLGVLIFIAGIYGLYILYLGFGPVTNVSEEKKVGYFIVSLITIVLVYAILGMVLGSLFGLFF